MGKDEKIKKIKNLNKKIVLAPMAGITNGDFCKRFKGLFGIVTIGAYSLDKDSLNASREIVKRGREEFIYNLDDFGDIIRDEIKKARESNALVSVNVRFKNLEESLERLKIISKHADIIELNCHCRQKEITNLGIGQELLKNKELLRSYLIGMADLNVPIFLKVRANFVGLEELIETLNYTRDYFDGIHIDCFNPGKDYADLEVLKEISKNFSDKIIIGNNSVKSIEDAKNMLRYANFVSVARCILRGDIEWIKEFNAMEM
ncbi:MJ0144 family RNA dihydrouridine synthase-like protein [Methanotorris igneus]|uniref:TIM-barrel protein n=1 Tax=Methanotorris igneus (strain DSM 5666 / JCM 11834 / Kol 5) TaxID=880724 RepID=F6BAD0_METIK|nr:MJ0144 family RNA dihydrouridine synthase-like protein [Methanotorris igneus]AEF95820.1 TIM-barrel protein [Methanotorris igneus Kol 5]